MFFSRIGGLTERASIDASVSLNVLENLDREVLAQPARQTVTGPAHPPFRNALIACSCNVLRPSYRL